MEKGCGWHPGAGGACKISVKCTSFPITKASTVRAFMSAPSSRAVFTRRGNDPPGAHSGRLCAIPYRSEYDGGGGAEMQNPFFILGYSGQKINCFLFQNDTVAHLFNTLLGDTCYDLFRLFRLFRVGNDNEIVWPAVPLNRDCRNTFLVEPNKTFAFPEYEHDCLLLKRTSRGIAETRLKSTVLLPQKSTPQNKELIPLYFPFPISPRRSTCRFHP